MSSGVRGSPPGRSAAGAPLLQGARAIDNPKGTWARYPDARDDAGLSNGVRAVRGIRPDKIVSSKPQENPMEANATLNMDNEQFTSTLQDNILIIKQKQHLLHLASRLPEIYSFYEYLDAMLSSKSAKALVMFAHHGKDDYLHYGKFLCKALSDSLGKGRMDRLLNIINSLFVTLSSLNSTTVYAGQGSISLFNMNLSLAYDYRIVADDAVFENLNASLGVITKGSGYYPARLLGVKKAAEVLQWASFSAEDALELGLVDRVVPAAKLEEEAMEFVSANVTEASSIRLGIRKLLKCDLEELRRTLELEDTLIIERLNSADFRKTLSSYCTKKFGCDMGVLAEVK